jgi:TM2 domain-containing membrane protein YozV
VVYLLTPLFFYRSPDGTGRRPTRLGGSGVMVNRRVAMKNDLKAALLSGLVIPGLGQIVLKRYKRGVVLLLAFSAGLAAIVVEAVRQALAIVDKIDLNGGPVDINTVSDMLARTSTASESPVFKLLFYLVIFCWIIGIVDAYRIGRKKDIAERLSK